MGFLNVSGILGGMNINGALNGVLSQALNNGGQREQFIAILLASAEHIGKKQNFNLEVEINDLNVRLGNLRQSGPVGGGGVFGQVTQAIMQMGNITAGINQAAQALVRNIR